MKASDIREQPRSAPRDFWQLADRSWFPSNTPYWDYTHNRSSLLQIKNLFCGQGKASEIRLTGFDESGEIVRKLKRRFMLVQPREDINNISSNSEHAYAVMRLTGSEI